MWHALAGHGPDPNKIKALDFACLSMIAARGSKGIYQHELVKLSGQDKRSLPARTDRLHNDGYIEKTRAAFQQLQPRKIVNTSHLILKRFAKSEPSAQSQNSPKHLSVDEYTESINNEDEDSNKQVGRPQWTPYRSLSSQIFELVAHSGTQGMTMKVSSRFRLSTGGTDPEQRPFAKGFSATMSASPWMNTLCGLWSVGNYRNLYIFVTFL